MNVAAVPLVLDLDGTLHAHDLSWLDFRRACWRRPWIALPLAPLALAARGRLKCALARGSDLDLTRLDYDPRVLQLAGEARAAGRRIVLATGSAQSLAEAVAQHLGLFDEVFGSSPGCNLVGAAKAEALVRRFGRRGFDYAGNSRADLQVWPQARAAIVVNAAPSVLHAARRIAQVETVIPPRGRAS